MLFFIRHLQDVRGLPSGGGRMTRLPATRAFCCLGAGVRIVRVAWRSPVLLQCCDVSRIPVGTAGQRWGGLPNGAVPAPFLALPGGPCRSFGCTGDRLARLHGICSVWRLSSLHALARWLVRSLGAAGGLRARFGAARQKTGAGGGCEPPIVPPFRPVAAAAFLGMYAFH